MTASRHLLAHTAKMTRTAFDPLSVEHMKIAHTFLTVGKQHETVRFTLEAPYLDVRSMLLNKISNQYMAEFFQKAEARKRPKKVTTA